MKTLFSTRHCEEPKATRQSRLAWMALIFCAALTLVAAPAFAGSLQWDFPSDWATIEGYTAYFNEAGDTETPYTKSVAKADLTQDGVSVTWADVDTPFNLQIGKTYDIYITAWNAAGESGPSNTAQISGPATYVPPADSLPTGTVIEIPNAAVTIRVQ